MFYFYSEMASVIIHINVYAILLRKKIPQKRYKFLPPITSIVPYKDYILWKMKRLARVFLLICAAVNIISWLGNMYYHNNEEDIPVSHLCLHSSYVVMFIFTSCSMLLFPVPSEKTINQLNGLMIGKINEFLTDPSVY